MWNKPKLISVQRAIIFIDIHVSGTSFNRNGTKPHNEQLRANKFRDDGVNELKL